MLNSQNCYFEFNDKQVETFVRKAHQKYFKIYFIKKLFKNTTLKLSFAFKLGCESLLNDIVV